MSKLFNFKLYKEGLRSLKIFGGISTVILSVISIFGTISESNTFGMRDNGVIEKTYSSLSEINPFLCLIFCVIAPLMTVVIFNFCNNRAASDFYFSVPMKREELYGSFFLASFSWTVIATLIPALITFILGIFLQKTLIINLVGSLIFMANILIAAFLVSSAVMVAVGLTGNPFSTIIVALFIIFLPRLLLFGIGGISTSNLPIISKEAMLTFVSPRLNIPVNATMYIFGTSQDPFGANADSMIYTFLLGLAYFVIGYFIFRSRKSEAAHNAAATPKLRAIFRIILSSAFLFLSTGFLFYLIEEKDESYISAIIFFFVCSLLSYFFYELITTKDFKGSLKSMPGFLYSIGINVAVLALMFGIKYSILEYSPKPSQIEGIYIEESNSSSEYWSDKASKILIENNDAKKIVSEALSSNIAIIKKAEDFDPYYASEILYNGERYIQWTVSIKSGLLNRTRRLFVPSEKSNELMRILEYDKDFSSVYKELPSATDNTTTVTINGSQEISIDEKDAKEIYKAYLEDVTGGKIPFKKHFNTVNYNYSEDSLSFMTVQTAELTSEYLIEVPITTAYPTAFAKYLEIVSKDNEDNRRKVEAQLFDINSGETESDSVNFEVIVPLNAENKYELYCDREYYPELIEALKKADKSYSPEKYVLRVESYIYIKKSFGDYTEYIDSQMIMAYYYLDENELKALKDIGGQLESYSIDDTH